MIFGADTPRRNNKFSRGSDGLVLRQKLTTYGSRVPFAKRRKSDQKRSKIVDISRMLAHPKRDWLWRVRDAVDFDDFSRQTPTGQWTVPEVVSSVFRQRP